MQVVCWRATMAPIVETRGGGVRLDVKHPHGKPPTSLFRADDMRKLLLLTALGLYASGCTEIDDDKDGETDSVSSLLRAASRASRCRVK